MCTQVILSNIRLLFSKRYPVNNYPAISGELLSGNIQYPANHYGTPEVILQCERLAPCLSYLSLVQFILGCMDGDEGEENRERKERHVHEWCDLFGFAKVNNTESCTAATSGVRS